ncbi:hypothetical protein HK096_001030, partial [Nowakowskiella sp. JEL0078]
KIVVDKLLRLPIYQTAKSVSIYISMPNGEIQTTDLIERLFLDGKDCYVPRWGREKTLEMVKLDSIDDFKSLPLNAWNIPEPSADENRISGQR